QLQRPALVPHGAGAETAAALTERARHVHGATITGGPRAAERAPGAAGRRSRALRRRAPSSRPHRGHTPHTAGGTSIAAWPARRDPTATPPTGPGQGGARCPTAGSASSPPA